jgi:hypothetical protein
MNYPADVGLLYESATQQVYLQGFRQGAGEMLKKVKSGK